MSTIAKTFLATMRGMVQSQYSAADSSLATEKKDASPSQAPQNDLGSQTKIDSFNSQGAAPQSVSPESVDLRKKDGLQSPLRLKILTPNILDGSPLENSAIGVYLGCAAPIDAVTGNILRKVFSLMHPDSKANFVGILANTPLQWSKKVVASTDPSTHGLSDHENQHLYPQKKLLKFGSDVEIVNMHGITRNVVASTLVSQSGKIYHIGNTFVSGGFGSVCLGLTAEGKRVAVKKLRNSMKMDSQGNVLKSKTRLTAQEALNRELTLQHHVDPDAIIDTISLKKKQYIVLKYMPCDSLELMNQVVDYDFTPLQKDFSFVQLVSAWSTALAKVHAAGVVHMDIKPEHFMLDAEGGMALTDFGASIFANEAPNSYAVGPVTYSYAAPEVISARINAGQDVSRSSDLWSLGACVAVLYNPDVPWPFSKCKSASDSIELHAAFKAWHSGLLHPLHTGGGRVSYAVNLSSILGNKSQWDTYFHAMTTRDPEMLHFLLRNLLNPDPLERSSLEEVAIELQDVHERCQNRLIRAEGSQAVESVKTLWLNARQPSDESEKYFKVLDVYRHALSKAVNSPDATPSTDDEENKA